jgi:thiosulfate/3-mercaptopyruvate sulfurtransferase
MPNMPQRRIPGALRFDIDTVKETSSQLPHMLPRPEAFAAAVGAMGIGDGMRIVVYDGLGLFSAPRVRWTFKTFGAKDVVILEGGFPQWKAEGRPVEEGPPAAAPRAASPPGSTIPPWPTPRMSRAPCQTARSRSSMPVPGTASAARRPSRAPACAPAICRVRSTCPFPAIMQDGKLKSPEAISAAFAEAGVDLDKPLITSCGSGVSAAILSAALETIGKPARAHL